MSNRYVTIAEYGRITGLSYPTIKKAVEAGQLKGVQTETGKWKIDTNADMNNDRTALINRLDEQGRMLKALCKQFNTPFA